MRSLVNAAAHTPVGGKGKKTYSKLIAAACILESPELDLGVRDFLTDSKSVVIRATGGRVMRHRARLNEWSAEGLLLFDERLLPESAMRKILGDAGQLIGLMDFRPEKKGPFGRFEVEF